MPFKPLYQGKPLNISGYFQPGREVNYITLTLNYSAENPFEIIYHEYVHQLKHNENDNVPIWLGEGMAELYSTFTTPGNSREVTLGKPKSGHVDLLRKNKFLPLGQLFQASHDSREYNEKDKQSIFYAESWALVHYLVLGNQGKRQPQLAKFLIGLVKGKPEAEAFRDAFLCDYAAMEKELRQYIGRDLYPVRVYTLRDPLEKTELAPARPLGEVEVAYNLGDLLLHGNRPEEAQNYLKQALSLDPLFAPAHASLGKYYAEQKNWEKAREQLEEAISQDSKDFLVPFVYAETVVTLESGKETVKERFSDETISRVFSQLRKTMQLAPDFVESYNLYGYVSLSTGKDMDGAIANLKKANSLAPGRSDIAFNLANLYSRKEDVASAKIWLIPLSRNANETGISLQARTLLDQIQQNEELNARMEKVRQEMEAERAKATAESIPEKSQRLARVDNQTDKPRLIRADEVSRKPPSPKTSAVFNPVQTRLTCSSCKKLAGILVATNCAKNGLVFVIKVGSRSWKFPVSDLENLFFFNSKGENLGSLTMKCGPVFPVHAVVDEYMPSEMETPDNPGKLINVVYMDR